MYKSSSTPILTEQRASAARNAACSDARIAAMRRTSALGRVNSFTTTPDPGQVAGSLGIGTGVNTANLQKQTIVSRAVGLLGTGSDYSSAAGGSPAGSTAQPSIQEIIRNAPKVVSLNRGGGCNVSVPPVPLGPDPTPGMPARAPAIVRTPAGPMNFQGAPSTIQGDYPPMHPSVVFASKGAPASAPQLPTQYYQILNTAGMSGYAPSWGNADLVPPPAGPAGGGVLNWITANPWLALAIAGGGLFAISKSKKGRR